MEQSYPVPASRNAISAQGISGKVNESPKAIGPDAKSQGEAAGTKQIVGGGAACNVGGFTGGGVINGKV